MGARRTTARYVPLVAHPRPDCLPLPQRVQALTELAGTAAEQNDPSTACTVCYQAALIASDVGVPATALALCHQLAAACLHAAPLDSRAAIGALEPVVNLTRLRIRAGKADDGYQHLLTLSNAVTAGTPIQVEDISVPADLVVNAAPTARWSVPGCGASSSPTAHAPRPRPAAGPKHSSTPRRTAASANGCSTAAKSPSSQPSRAESTSKPAVSWPGGTGPPHPR
ncbi:hypothetical protein [Streptantibioticus silvisoli]|uniref:hypothetical protein n=1 Tax=Streptantibioticus silvisoli TaxID=2705255 RepID=UPI003F6D1F65